MFTLPLDDPLWRKLDDAHRQTDIPGVLRRLAADWDTETSNSLFWDDLCHQDTCYGATYAAIPHLLEIAGSSPEAASDIALFLGYVATVAFEPYDGATPQGLPDTLDAWDRKLDPYRSLATRYAHDPDGPYREATLNRYRDLLSRPPVDVADLATIARIRAAFREALPRIADLCEKVARASDAEARKYLLGGIAAGLGDPVLGRLFSSGDDGGFSCPACHWQHEYLVAGDRMAVYASPVGPEVTARTVDRDEPIMLDYSEGVTDRASGFVTPSDVPETDAVRRILALVIDLDDTANLDRLRLFSGTYACTKCKATFPLTSA